MSIVKIISSTTISILLSLTLVTTSNAQGTPDWQTPAMETVCDSEAPPGRGLCVAFCEAMDCDDDPNANQSACNNVKQKWQNKTGKTDLPCEVSCPCNDIDGYQAISNGTVSSFDCFDASSHDEMALFSVAGNTAAAIAESGIFLGCGYFPDSGPSVVLPADQEEATFCVSELRAQAAAQNVACNQQ